MTAQNKTILCPADMWTVVSGSLAIGDALTLQVQDWVVGASQVYVTATDGTDALAAPGASIDHAIYQLPASGGFIAGTIATLWPGLAAPAAPAIRVYPVRSPLWPGLGGVLVGISHA